MSLKNKFSVGIIGGGIAGSTAAIKLARNGYEVTLFESSESLVNGPPFCHLHAGGNLYREISDEQCITLLKECIETIKMYPHTMNIRPTVIAIPTCDNGQPEDLLPRLKKVQNAYKNLCEKDKSNQLLGLPENYYKLYDKKQLLELANYDCPKSPVTLDEWMVPVARTLDLTKMKFPLYMVNEYGWSMFRTAASVLLDINQLTNCTAHLRSKVIGLKKNGDKWLVKYKKYNAVPVSTRRRFNVDSTSGDVETTLNRRHVLTGVSQSYETKSIQFDYIINACGFQTGSMDDLVGVWSKRMVEFKAAYVCQWQDADGEWPEVIIHGKRGTPNGMAQLTPYPGKIFQLHGMTDNITLFKDGLISSSSTSAQPKLKESFNKKLAFKWCQEEIEVRTNAAIQHISQYIPVFKTARCAGPPLFGAQQIPGTDPVLRTASVCFEGSNYARMEIVKASSAITASKNILEHLEINSKNNNPVSTPTSINVISTSSDVETTLIDVGVLTRNLIHCPFTSSRKIYEDVTYSDNLLEPSEENINKLSCHLAIQRGYPRELALPVGKILNFKSKF